MIRAITIILLFNIPFLLGGAGLIYWGYITEAKSLTDNESPKLIFYIIGTAIIGIPFLISLVSLCGAVKKRNRIQEIVTYGKPGTAKMLKLEDTNLRINDNPQVRLLLEISIPNYPTYQAEKTLALSMIYLPRVQLDSIVNVLAEPDDKFNGNRIGLVFE